MPALRNTSWHAPDCPCKRCQNRAYNTPNMGEPSLIVPIDHAQRHRPVIVRHIAR